MAEKINTTGDHQEAIQGEQDLTILGSIALEDGGKTSQWLKPDFDEGRRGSEADRLMAEAVSFFESNGFVMGDNGRLSPPFTEEQLDFLSSYVGRVAEENNYIYMPTIEDFYRQTLMAVSLFPQEADGKITYLMGRGAGIEAALQGQVVGRTKNDIRVEYRTHSDFELYGRDYEHPEGSLSNSDPSEQMYTEEFERVFGAMEYFPPSATKGLRNLPDSLMYDTSELVDLGGVMVRIPSLEILALDKIVDPNTASRPGGLDPEVLALVYDLDRGVMEELYDRYTIENTYKREYVPIDKEYDEITDRVIARHKRELTKLVDQMQSEFDFSKGEAIDEINRRFSEFIGSPELVPQIIEKQARRNVDNNVFMRSLQGDPQEPVPAEDRLSELLAWSFRDLIDMLQPITVTEEIIDSKGEEVEQSYYQQIREGVIKENYEDLRKKRFQLIDQFFDRVEEKRGQLQRDAVVA